MKIRNFAVLIVSLMCCAVVSVALTGCAPLSPVKDTAKDIAKPDTNAKTTGIEASASNFIQQLADGDFVKAAEKFDDTRKATAPPERLEKDWKFFFTQYGRFEKQLKSQAKETAHVEKSGVFQAVIVSCEFEKAFVDWQVIFNTTGKIIAYSVAQSHPKTN